MPTIFLANPRKLSDCCVNLQKLSKDTYRSKSGIPSKLNSSLQLEAIKLHGLCRSIKPGLLTAFYQIDSIYSNQKRAWNVTMQGRCGCLRNLANFRVNEPKRHLSTKLRSKTCSLLHAIIAVNSIRFRRGR